MKTFRVILVNQGYNVVYPPIYAEDLEDCFVKTQNYIYDGGSWFDAQGFYTSTNPKLLARFEERRNESRSSMVGDIFQDTEDDRFYEVLSSGFKEIQYKL